MQVSELIALQEWYFQQCHSNGLIDKFTALVEKIRQNISVSGYPFEEEKEQLVDALSHMSFKSLTIEQEAFLTKLDLRSYLGENGIDQVENILYKNQLDIATASEKFGHIVENFSKASEFFSCVETKISPLFPEKHEEITEMEAWMRVYFQEKASITNVVEFKEYARKWYDITRGIALAVDKRPEDIRIVSAERGSIIINAAVLTVIAEIFSKVVLRSLEIAEKILELKKKKMEIEALKLEKEINDNLTEDLKDAIDSTKKNGAETICKAVIDELKITDSEKKSGLRKSIELMLEFLENGGNIDFICNELPENDVDEDNEIVELREIVRSQNEKLVGTVEKIRQIEHKLMLLSEGEKEF